MASGKAGQRDSFILRVPYYCVFTEVLIGGDRSPAAGKFAAARQRRRGVSGDAVADLELLLRPGFLIKYFAEDLHRIPDLGEAGVQRGEAEPHDPRLAVIADHATGDQGLDHRI